jgi:hypothetical protein
VAEMGSIGSDMVKLLWLGLERGRDA